MQKPLISVLMPVYNTKEEYLRQAIESILNQTLSDFEFIIFNDGSTNNAKDVILSYKDSRIKYFEHENCGIAKTTNKMLDIAQGKYIALMDSDDISLPNRFKIQVEFLESNPDVSIVSAGYKVIGEDRVYIPKSSVTFFDLLKENCVANPVAMYRIEDIRKYSLKLDEFFNCAQDYEFYSRAIRHVKIRNIQEVLLEYRILPNSNSHSNLIKMQEMDKLIQNNMIIFLSSKKGVFSTIERLLFVKKYKKLNKKNTFLQKIFSVKNSPDKNKKVITILGIKIKIKRKHIEADDQYVKSVKKVSIDNVLYYGSDLVVDTNLNSNFSLGGLNEPVVEVVDPIFLPPIYEPKTRSFLGGVLNSKFEYIDASARYRNLSKERIAGAFFGKYEFDENNVNYVNDDVIYLGDFINHWGHFLLESSSRFWYLIDNYKKGMKVAFCVYDNKTLLPNFIEFLKLFGISLEDILFLHKPTKFRSAIVPKSATILGTCWFNEFANIFDSAVSKVKTGKREKNIYLSREKFNFRPTRGEKFISQIYKNNGYKVLYPEQLSLLEMIAYLKNAENIAGLSGTALHNVLFANKESNIHVLFRSKSCQANNFLCQRLISDVKQQKTFFIDASFDFLPCEEGPFFVGLTPEVCLFFDDLNFKYNKKSILPSKKDLLWWFENFINYYSIDPNKSFENDEICKYDFSNYLKKNIKLFK